MRYGSILIILLLCLAACRENADHTSSAPRDSASTPTPASPAPSSTPEGFEKSLFHEFAHVATAVPKRITDSIIHSHSDPRQIEAAMKGYLRRRDSLTRAVVASRYGITMDSLNAIIARGNAERW